MVTIVELIQNKIRTPHHRVIDQIPKKDVENIPNIWYPNKITYIQGDSVKFAQTYQVKYVNADLTEPPCVLGIHLNIMQPKTFYGKYTVHTIYR